jgi:5-methyltetrahydrofolate--homocysteine methyltransferase
MHWQELIASPGVILADGAMGTMLFEAGLQFGEPPERWNVDYPERVQAVHQAYLQAGSRILLTNTFGGNRWRLSLHKLEGRARELVEAGARTTRAAVEAAGGRALVAGDIGPSGSLLAPLGELEEAEAVTGFAEQAEALLAGGADVIWIETMSDLGEVAAAVRGVRQASSEVPILTTMTFDTHGRTMMGVTPEKAVQTLSQQGAAAVGGNCGNGPEEILGVLEKMHAVSPQMVLIAKANAGLPTLVNGRAVYAATPESMGEYAQAAAARGARIVGACCGSTPAHLQAMATALAGRLAG